MNLGIAITMEFLEQNHTFLHTISMISGRDPTESLTRHSDISDGTDLAGRPPRMVKIIGRADEKEFEGYIASQSIQDW